MDAMRIAAAAAAAAATPMASADFQLKCVLINADRVSFVKISSRPSAI